LNTEKHSDDSTKQIPILGLKVESAAEDPIDSLAREHYVTLALAVMGDKDVGPAMKEIAGMPLEKRYTWRVALALKCAFADFENLSVVVDRRTLRQEDRDRLMDLLRVLPFQFCMFLATLFGEEQMERLISSSIQQVKTLRVSRLRSLEPESGNNRR